MDKTVKNFDVKILFLLLPIGVAFIFRPLWFYNSSVTVSVITMALNILINPLYLNVISSHLAVSNNISLKTIIPISVASNIGCIVIQYSSWKQTTDNIDQMTHMVVLIEAVTSSIIILIGLLILIFIRIRRNR